MRNNDDPPELNDPRACIIDLIASAAVFLIIIFVIVAALSWDKCL